MDLIKIKKYGLPDGYVSIALKHVRSSLMASHLYENHCENNEYYIQIARCEVAKAFIRRRNEESRPSRYIRIKDLTYQLSMFGVPYKTRGNGAIDFCIGNLQYRFLSHKLSLMLKEKPLYIEHPTMSAKNLIKLLIGIADAVQTIDRHVLEAVDGYHNDFKVQQLMLKTLEGILEPGLEDVDYLYRCKSKESGMSLEIWIFYSQDEEHSDSAVLLPLKVSDFLDNPDGYKNMVRRIAGDFEAHNDYPFCARVMDIYDDFAPVKLNFAGKKGFW